MKHIPAILRIDPMKYFCSKFTDVTDYNYLKQAAMSASDYIKTVYRHLRILMHLTQCCVFIRYLDAVQPLINNLMVQLFCYFVAVIITSSLLQSKVFKKHLSTMHTETFY